MRVPPIANIAMGGAPIPGLGMAPTKPAERPSGRPRRLLGWA
jgi:hypothetical protein